MIIPFPYRPFQNHSPKNTRATILPINQLMDRATKKRLEKQVEELKQRAWKCHRILQNLDWCY